MGEVGGAPRTPPTFFPTNINKVESRRFGSQWPSSADADGQRNPARWRCPAGRCPGFRARRRSHQVAGPCCDRGAEFSSGCIPDTAGSVPRPGTGAKIASPRCPAAAPPEREPKFREGSRKGAKTQRDPRKSCLLCAFAPLRDNNHRTPDPPAQARRKRPMQRPNASPAHW